MFHARPLPLGLVLCACFGLIVGRTWGAPLLPDLQIESRIPQVTTINGKRLLRFTTWSLNLGLGPIELRGGAINGDQQDVDQRIYDSNGGFTNRRAGTFIYHPSHGHIHFEEFADYYLKEVTAEDGVGGTLGASEKVSFCLLDTQKASPPHPDTPANVHYVECESFQGISVGWVDVYNFTLPGQNIDLTGVSSGTYWLEAHIDRGNRLVESNEDNNSSRRKVSVTTVYVPEVEVRGNGQPIASGDPTPASSDHTDFGYVDVGTGSVTRTFTVQNLGDGQLSLLSVPKVAISGSGDFTITAQPVSPVAVSGGTTTFQVTFNPSVLGIRSATVVIANNDSNEASYQFAIVGNADADGDGLPDGWETLHNVMNSNADDDGDGYSNYNEYVAGTLPRDATSRLAIKTATITDGTFQISFESLSGRIYRVDYKNGLGGTWEPLDQRVGDGTLMTVTDLIAAGEEQRFYRLGAGF